MSKAIKEYLESHYDPSLPTAVWSRSSESRPDGRFWRWHSVAFVSGDRTVAVCGAVIYGPTLDQTTMIGHWPKEIDSAFCGKCVDAERPFRLAAVESDVA